MTPVRGTGRKAESVPSSDIVSACARAAARARGGARKRSANSRRPAVVEGRPVAPTSQLQPPSCASLAGAPPVPVDAARAGRAAGAGRAARPVAPPDPVARRPSPACRRSRSVPPVAAPPVPVAARAAGAGRAARAAAARPGRAAGARRRCRPCRRPRRPSPARTTPRAPSPGSRTLQAAAADRHGDRAGGRVGHAPLPRRRAPGCSSCGSRRPASPSPCRWRSACRCRARGVIGGAGAVDDDVDRRRRPQRRIGPGRVEGERPGVAAGRADRRGGDLGDDRVLDVARVARRRRCVQQFEPLACP